MIWLCAEKELQNMHFDVRQFNFIAYTSPQDAQVRLYNRIIAQEGEGPGMFTKPSA